ncbi:MAG TPA: hypothetical protein EYQ73_05650 [Candidatus Poseidoniales archaeon]|jgi:HAD superfamily phosphoserine phosphatase-like hydrolase|nr:MAG: hypothetical protein CXT71_07715 [Euryarchaeota archaeon]HIF46262.1 hypothetical protein [Candidatus Poseidoniales archaeon]HIL65528.1 hypothetical protein [Candidatus Poseidoniales archaeon]
MGEVAAYFDLDGTLLDDSSEKTLAFGLAKRRPWRIPLGSISWLGGFVGNLLRGRSVYDAARNRGHFSLSSWRVLKGLSEELVESKLKFKISKDAQERLEWHRNQGHRLVLVTATIMPMAIALGQELGMDEVYGCGPKEMNGMISGSERGWSVPRRKGKVPVVEKDAKENNHDLAKCYAYGNTHADSFFMRLVGNPIAVNPEGKLKDVVAENNWETYTWKV